MQRVFLDAASTTRLDPEVLEAMGPYLAGAYGNPGSAHALGREARDAVETARKAVAALIGARPGEIAFTSGGTEANNAALKGVAFAAGGRGHVVVTAIEHESVLRPAAFLESLGLAVTRLRVDGLGRVDPDEVRAAIRPGTVLVSVMHANNEIGTVQPVAEIATAARASGVPFHTDAVQTAGHVETDVGRIGADLLSLSGHKLHGPKGVGALYVRAGTRLEPLLHGGSQEAGLRASTPNVPGIVGFGKAAELARKRLRRDTVAIEGLWKRLLEGVLARVRDVRPNGHPTARVPGILSLSFADADGGLLARELDRHGFAVATGSSCRGPDAGPSHVLVAIGMTEESARGTLRFSIGRDVCEQDIDRLLDVLPRAVRMARSLAGALD